MRYLKDNPEHQPHPGPSVPAWWTPKPENKMATNLKDNSVEQFRVTLISKITDEDLFNIFVGALEGGIGYWSAASEYHWQAEFADGKREDLRGFFAVIEFRDENNKLRVRKITRATILKGLRLLATGGCDWGGREMNPKMVAKFALAVLDLDAANLDAGDYDNIVQAGLFGDIIFG